MKHSTTLQKIIYTASVLMCIIFLASCNCPAHQKDNAQSGSKDSTQLSGPEQASLDSTVQFLMDMSAKDFFEHQPPVPLDFRDVKLKYLTKSTSEKTYLICGQFLSKDNQNKESWINFATIKTDPYEQWMGSNAASYCQDSKEITYSKTDLSATLKSAFESLQKKSK